ncbi:MAG: DUF4399 domain-containing protein [Bacteroidia bacterium]|nr:DUF4399 domain-containing protein [Bacteroidia bacterium]
MKKLFFIPALALLASCAGNHEQAETSADSMNNMNMPADHTQNEKVKIAIQPVKPGQEVYFENLKDGDVVKSPLLVKFGVKGMTVEPAGVITEDKGHHHLIIDGTFVEEGYAVPMSDVSIHYGKGQLEDTINLTPGKHTLTMQFANGSHVSYGEAMSKTITVEVK